MLPAQATSVEIMKAMAAGDLAALPQNKTLEDDVDDLLAVVEAELKNNKALGEGFGCVVRRRRVY